MNVEQISPPLPILFLQDKIKNINWEIKEK